MLTIHPQVKYTKIYLRDTTLIPPFPLLLFGGDIDIQHRERLITLDGWIHFQVRGRQSFPCFVWFCSPEATAGFFLLSLIYK